MMSGPADQPDGGDKEYYDEDEGVGGSSAP